MVGAFIVGLLAGAGLASLILIRRKTKPSRRNSLVPTELGDRIAELSEVTGALAHEIRNPLSTLKVNLGLLTEDWRDADEHDPDIRRRSLVRIEGLQSEAERLQHILDDFMRFAGQHDVNLKPTNLNAVLEKVIDFTTPQAAGAGIRIRPSLSTEELWSNVDENLFEQALLNIILNAQQAMPDGGDLIVKSQACDGQAQLDIADTGAGIPPEAIDKIFRAYYSTKKQGTGLGLSVTRRIVAEHGGTIAVQSDPERGTNFTIRLPLTE